MKTYFPATVFLILVLLQPLSAQNGDLSGLITDALNGEPLIGAAVQIEGTDRGAVTDVDGYYTITNIPPQSYNITASYLGYTPLTKFNVVIRSEGNVDLNFKLEESAVELNELVVRPNPFQKSRLTPLSIQKLSQDEIASYPGGNNDVAKVVQTLPGVSGSVGGFRNDVIIRGGAPNENVYYLDGIEIPNINHFSTQGSAGGPVGLLNVSFFEGVSLTSSAFGAQYDNVLSGVLQFDQRNGNASDFRGNIRVGASEAALTLEGPLFKKGKERANTTFIVSARRSYLQLLFKLLELPFLPDYWDFQYKINHKINDYNEITFTGVASIDDFRVNELKSFDPEQQAVQDQVPVIKQNTNSAGLIWKRRFRDNSGVMETILSINLLNNKFRQYNDNVNLEGLFFENDSREQETKLRYRLTKFGGKWSTSYGFSLQYANYRNLTIDQINNFDYETRLDFMKYGLFVQTSAKFANDRIGLSLGLRADGNTFTENGNELFRTLSPRAALSYKLTEDGKWNVNLTAGRYYKLPPYTILGFRDNEGGFTNKNAEYISTDHLVGGVEYLLSESSRISVEGFLKLYDNYPVSLVDSISIANEGGGFEVLGNEPVESAGKGRTYGVEFLYQQKFTGNFYAIVAYTLYWSRFTGFDRNDFTPSTWDNRHLVSLTGGYKFRKNWELSARYRFLGNAPYAPVDETATLANYPAVVLDYSRFGDVRLDPFNQLDIRIDKKWNFKKVSFDLYLDVENVLGLANPTEPLYGLARNELGEIKEPNELIIVNENSSGTVLPSIGIVLNF